tara:strand:+ start:198 stop:347 length:150 start_codon:yes stop_codon:yes gene_type:complete
MSNTETTIDVTPTRKGTTVMLIEIIKNGTPTAAKWAAQELVRICPEEWD